MKSFLTKCHEYGTKHKREKKNERSFGIQYFEMRASMSENGYPKFNICNNQFGDIF